MPKKTFVLMTLALLLAACLPGAAQPPADVQSQVNTAIAQTMEINRRVAENVQQTLTALAPAASPTPQPTSTPEPTFETFTLITDTPLPLLIPPTEPPSYAGPTATEVKFSCYVTTLKPKPGAEANRKQDFDIVWLIVNTGTRPILAGTDFKFSGGINMANATRVEITKDVNTGESFRVELDGNAPDEKGVKYMAWKLTSPICYGEVYITVK